MNSTPDEETVLLHRYATTGDAAAFADLVARHGDFVYSAARRQLRGDEHLADDVAQAVFIVLARKPASVRPGHLLGWLLRTTCYAASDARKRQARRAYHE